MGFAVAVFQLLRTQVRLKLYSLWHNEPLYRRTWYKGLLVRQLTLRGLFGAQPQRDVGGLHRLPYHPHQVVAEGVHVRLVSQLGREGFQGLPGIVLTSVEATVYEGLNAPS